jgi:putative hemolysin
VQVGITLVGVLAGAYGGARLAEPLAAQIATWPDLARYAGVIALGLVVAGITFLSLILGELAPKNIALTHPETIASWVARPMMWLARAGGPVVRLLTATTSLVLRVFGIRAPSDSELTEDEIRAVISQGAESGAIPEAEADIVDRVLGLGDQRVSALMTPRHDIEWVDVDATPDQLREFLASHTHTQFVVCQSGLDNVLGIVMAAELLQRVMKGGPIQLRSLTRTALFVPDSLAAVKLLESFRRSHKHVALVMDEHGAVQGLVTVTDLLEAMVGSLSVDAAEAAAMFTMRADGSWLIDGSAPLDEIAGRLEMEPPDEEAGSYHTIGGFVMARLGRVPKAADRFEWGGMRFEVMDMDGRRIDKVLVERLPGVGGPETAGDATDAGTRAPGRVAAPDREPPDAPARLGGSPAARRREVAITKLGSAVAPVDSRQ